MTSHHGMLARLWFWTAIVAASKSSVQPLSIPPSLYWDGDDGQWSTFFVQVGDPPQTLRLLPGTSASAGTIPWVIIDPGCSATNPTLTDCDDKRGGVYFSNSSDTWSVEGLQVGVDGAIYSLNTFEESALNRKGNGSYGYDTITLGANGENLPTLEKQLIAGVWTNDFFIGSLGLSPYAFNLSNFQDPQPSILSTLHNRSLIPSLSWAYTAGAAYQSPETFGSLTLGGYDATRFVPNNATFSFGADFSRDLVVELQSLTYDTEGALPLLTSSNSIEMFIDTMVPEIWLPVGVCELFQQKFNLTWSEQGQLYMIKAAAHTALVAQNPTFTFTVGQPGANSSTNNPVEIVLPYAAFDLNLTAPIVGNDTHYFPIRQAQNDTQYTLGRTFLQEAYVTVDYGRRNFSVAQAVFPTTSVQQDLVAIVPPREQHTSSSTHLSSGALAGIVIGAVAVVSGMAIVVWCRVRKWRQRQTGDPARIDETKLSLPDLAEFDSSEQAIMEVDGSRDVKPELEGHEGAHGRHELFTVEGVKEAPGSAVPIELEAPLHR